MEMKKEGSGPGGGGFQMKGQFALESWLYAVMMVFASWTLAFGGDKRICAALERMINVAT